MSRRGATHRGTRRRKGPYVPKNMRGQRNRKMDKAPKQLSTMSMQRFSGFVRSCRSKVAHSTYANAMAAVHANELKYPDKKYYVYECPCCGKWHLTTHPWEREK